jgi:hypothetical protein
MGVDYYLDKFSMTEHGLFFGKGTKRERIAQPFETLGPIRADGEWGVLLSFESQDGQWRSVFVSRSAILGRPRKLAARLTDRGMRFEAAPRAWRVFAEYLFQHLNERSVI